MFTARNSDAMQLVIEETNNNNDELNINFDLQRSLSKSVTSPRSKQDQEDTKTISLKLAAEYERRKSQMRYNNDEKDDESKSDEKSDNKKNSKDFKKKQQKILSKYFRNKDTQNEWWEYIDGILELIDNDYKLSLALFRGKIFQTIPQVGIEKLAVLCGKDFGNSFTNNPHSLDISYKLLH